MWHLAGEATRTQGLEGYIKLLHKPSFVSLCIQHLQTIDCRSHHFLPASNTLLPVIAKAINKRGEGGKQDTKGNKYCT